MAKPRKRATVPPESGEIRVRRMHRRDINRVWDFLKLVFRDVNKNTVEYQRPLNKRRFEEQYEADAVEQLIFEIEGAIVGYAEAAYTATGTDNWINPRYFDNRDMRPLFVEELASHPAYHGMGVGSFMLEQLQHLARVRGCTHLVLEVAENNRPALSFYRKRNFFKLDASIFLAQKVATDPELLPPRSVARRKKGDADTELVAPAEEATPLLAEEPPTPGKRVRIAASVAPTKAPSKKRNK